ncbi:MAG: helix-turn-helix domain-containing protein [Candidatus Aminicenantes bacterium]|jgi:predicted transcriptional regulator
MTKADIIKALEDLGLSNYEAKAYLAFLSESPLTGYKLSKISGVPRSRIYETIEKLTAKGLVLAQEGDTTLLRPISLESFLEKKEQESRKTIDYLKENLPKIEKTEEDHGIWNITGRERVFEIINYVISQSKSHIYLVSFENDIVHFESELLKAEKRDVFIFGVYCGKKTFKIKNLDSHQGQPCSTCQDIALSIDSRQALVGCTVPADKARVALTENPGIIHVAEEYIKHEIFISRVFKTLENTSFEKFNAVYQEILGKLP